MSLAINTTIPEGIVMAADSRQSYRNRKGMARIGSDNASKLFQLNHRIGIALAGLAFLPENSGLRSVSSYIKEFIENNPVDNYSIEKTADELIKLLNEKYDWNDQLNKAKEQIEKDLLNKKFEILEITKKESYIDFRYKDTKGNTRKGIGKIDPISFIIAGINQDGSQQAFTCYVPGNKIKSRDNRERGKEYGPNWIGQTDVVSRIVLGFDGRIINLPFVQDASSLTDRENVLKQLHSLEYVIQWGTMTLQDAIDFCTLMIETTSAIQRFSDGIKANPGELPGVGGPVEVLTITPEEGFKWVRRKRIMVHDHISGD
ncbi:MAG: hypothetical protein PHQ99_04265 [Atribacterota bacterium]|jgi:peptidoglycan/xylan/chitin deacetylase (PgdA/CDA1 family)|nr:hypothetical protein [Atribacterota bacterium]MDD4288781.1 hypothetical protein [Atribacterota bacterium]MDD4764927.1 hypothetical protein [Atribacterota bacterium]MDI9596828.1 hypothetical protein [Atribacterota bacterium]